MGRGVIEPEAFESGRALLEVVSAEDYVGVSKAGVPFEKLNIEYKVVSYEEQEEDDGEWIGETFTDGGYYKQGKDGTFGIPLRGKLPNTIESLKGEEYFTAIKSGKKTFEPEHLLGDRLRAQVEISEKGYSSIVWNTISPAKKPRTSKKAEKVKAEKDLEEQNAQDLEAAELSAEEEAQMNEAIPSSKGKKSKKGSDAA
jgi:hypothetical protein